MKRLAPLFASLILSIVIPGCGEEAPPPAGTIGTGTSGDSGPAEKGLAKLDREKMFKYMNEPAPKNGAKKSK